MYSSPQSDWILLILRLSCSSTMDLQVWKTKMVSALDFIGYQKRVRRKDNCIIAYLSKLHPLLFIDFLLQSLDDNSNRIWQHMPWRNSKNTIMGQHLTAPRRQQGLAILFPEDCCQLAMLRCIVLQVLRSANFPFWPPVIFWFCFVFCYWCFIRFCILWYSIRLCILFLIHNNASTRRNSIIICKILVYKNGPVPEIRKCGCLYEMKFYTHHLQNFDMQEWSCPWNRKNVITLWDEILYSSFAKFRYARMILFLKSEKCGCLYEMKFYIHHLQNFSIQEWPWPWNRKSVVASMKWNSIFIICKKFGI